MSQICFKYIYFLYSSKNKRQKLTWALRISDVVLLHAGRVCKLKKEMALQYCCKIPWAEEPAR